jgi:hypothetical protein
LEWLFKRLTLFKIGQLEITIKEKESSSFKKETLNLKTQRNSWKEKIIVIKKESRNLKNESRKRSKREIIKIKASGYQISQIKIRERIKKKKVIGKKKTLRGKTVKNVQREIRKRKIDSIKSKANILEQLKSLGYFCSRRSLKFLLDEHFYLCCWWLSKVKDETNRDDWRYHEG